MMTRSMLTPISCGRLGVLGDGPDAATEAGAAHELVEGDHHERWPTVTTRTWSIADVGVEEREQRVLVRGRGADGDAADGRVVEEC